MKSFISELTFSNCSILAAKIQLNAEFYNDFNLALACAPELFYELRKLFHCLKAQFDHNKIDLTSDKIHPIYKNHLKDETYILTMSDYLLIIESILKMYCEAENLKNKLSMIPAAYVISYMLNNENKETFLLMIHAFDQNGYFLEELYKHYKKFTNKELLQMFIGLLKNGYTIALEDEFMINEMLDNFGHEFYNQIRYINPETLNVTEEYMQSPTHFFAYLHQHPDKKQTLLQKTYYHQLDVIIKKYC